jgi:hypothetical protein
MTAGPASPSNAGRFVLPAAAGLARGHIVLTFILGMNA